MRALLILLTTVAWDTLFPTLLGAPGPQPYWPRLAVFWVCFLAEDEAEFVARAQEVFWSGLMMSLVLGLLTDFALSAPRGVHAAIFVVAYFFQRLVSTRELSPLALFLTVAIVGGAVEAAEWYVKGFMVRWAVLPPFRPYLYVIQGAMLGLLAVIFFKPLHGRFASRG